MGYLYFLRQAQSQLKTGKNICKTKENLKKIAKEKGLTMSELVNECLTELIEKKNFNEKYNEKLEKRSIKTDEKLKNLKSKMNW